MAIRSRRRINLAEADGAGGARAERGAVVLVGDTEGAEHAGGLGVRLVGVSARGPGGGGAAEVLAVVPGGGGEAASGSGVGDGAGGPHGLEERLGVHDLEVGDVRELYHGKNKEGMSVRRRCEDMCSPLHARSFVLCSLPAHQSSCLNAGMNRHLLAAQGMPQHAHTRKPETTAQLLPFLHAQPSPPPWQPRVRSPCCFDENRIASPVN